ncbi:MAG: hypothetical protein ABS951_04000 [Solibacillus sp.]
MDQLQVNELKESYYEYIAKIPQGLQTIVGFLVNDKLEKAFNGIINLAEGLEFLLKVEQVLAESGFCSNSRIEEAMEIFKEINSSFENQDYILLKDLIEYELIPLFGSASEWGFRDEVK